MIDKTFLSTLYQNCDNGVIELRALPSKKQRYIQTDSLDGLDEFCSAPSDNYYFGVALRDGKGGSKENITQFPAVWCECDYKDTPIESVRENLKKFPFKPSLLVKSGGGVHIYFLLKEPANKSDLKQIENINLKIAAAIGADTVAHEAARILRIPGTINYKYSPAREVSLAINENYFYNLEDFNELPEAPIKTQKEINNSGWLSEMMMGVSDGHRGDAAIKIAGYWINKLPPSDVLAILQSWNQNNTPPMEESRILTTVKSATRYAPDIKDVDLDNIYTATKMVESYRQYISTLKNNKFITGIKEIDMKIRGVAGGEVLTIIARAGSFKTAMLQNLLLNYTQNSAWAAVFFSIEMPIPNVTERYFGMLDGCTGHEVETMFSNPEQDAARRAAENQFIRDMKNLYVIPTKIGLVDIPKYIKLIESKYNVKVGVIGIDYMGLIDGPGSSSYEIMSKIARGAKTTAKEINIPTILLCQASRKGGDGEIEISLDMGRDSGAIEEGADFVLGLWQIENNDEYSNRDYDLICRILKNRKGPKGSRWTLDINPQTFKFSGDAFKYDPPKKKKAEI